MRKKFVAIVGYGQSGKSTIIQSLTGCENRGFFGIVEDTSVNLSMYVHAKSPQENPATDEKTFIDILQDVLDGKRIQGLAIAIQPTSPRQRLSMDRMFVLAKKAGFESYAFILDPPRGGRSTDFEGVRDRVLAGDPMAQVFKLDARRFAVLNSEAIRVLARLPY